MIGYYLRLALIGIRKNLVLSALMVAAVGLGIGACMTFVTIKYLLEKDPIPAKSDVLYHVQLDSWSPNRAADDDGTPPNQLTYTDAMALMAAGRAHRQAAMVATAFVVEPLADDGADAPRPFDVNARATFADFFAMFDVPFQYGAGWSADADADRQQVAVLSRETNERLFGGEDSTGRDVRMSGHLFRVVGVLDEWKPVPKFYDLNNNAFGDIEDVFVPFNLVVALELPRVGNTNCWKPVEGDGLQAFLASECIWIQFWAELRDEAERQDYLAHLDAYANEQKQLGRFERPLNNRASDVNAWLDDQRQGEEPATVLVAVGVMFLAVCLLNTVALLLAKFLGAAPEIGLRRALGASKRALFAQYLVESGSVGLLGGMIGVGLTWVFLRGIEYLFGDFLANLVLLDATLVAGAVVLAILSSIVAGLYPTWRACRVEPAGQLKVQ